MRTLPYLFASACVVLPIHSKYSNSHQHRCFINSFIRSTRLRTSARSLRMDLEATSDSPFINLNPGDVLVERMLYDSLVWCTLRGIVVGDSTFQESGSVPGVGVIHAPFSLLPAFFPENQFMLAREVAPIFNELVDRISLDGGFLQTALSRTRKADPFTSKLLDIHLKLLKMNKKEEIRLGLHRSDYMLDQQTNSLLQIELNTISSSFPGLSSQITTLHRTLIKHYKEELGLDYNRVPPNSAMLDFADALALAWKEFNNPKGVIMIIVQAEERNMYDQHWLSSSLLERYNVRTIRKTLGEVEALGKQNLDGTLVVEGKVVSVVYYRAGYTPIDYPSEAEWSARLLIEQSSAIKCPNISYHLTGTKKIQQELAKPGILEKFMDSEQVAKVRKLFAGLWSLDDAEAVKNAVEYPELFVMKPQREGGGNNIYGNDVKEKLLELKMGESEEEAAYILMQRIFPKICETLFVRNGKCWKDMALSELGVYGAYLRNKDTVVMNKDCGYLLRTKVSSSNEGGVAAGYAVLDSVFLT